ncbi:uncharacterized protein LOC144432573 [Glandiceps talaboti]
MSCRGASCSGVPERSDDGSESSQAVDHDDTHTQSSTLHDSNSSNDSTITQEVMYPAVPQYGPVNVYDLKPGDKKLWCLCGLSKKQPWCDGSHVGTGFKPIKWEVPAKPQRLYQLCACKYTQKPPYCDATHTYLPMKVIQRQKTCIEKGKHSECNKLCNKCGWVPDF